MYDGCDRCCTHICAHVLIAASTYSCTAATASSMQLDMTSSSIGFLIILSVAISSCHQSSFHEMCEEVRPAANMRKPDQALRGPQLGSCQQIHLPYESCSCMHLVAACQKPVNLYMSKARGVACVLCCKVQEPWVIRRKRCISLISYAALHFACSTSALISAGMNFPLP